MDKFKFGLFDVFVYSLPGFIVLSTLITSYFDFNLDMKITIKFFFLLINKLNVYSSILLFIISYILGFVFHYFGYIYFSFIGKKLWKKIINNLESSPFSNEQKFAIVRHFSKENFIYVEQWYAFRGMSFNLSLAFLLLFIVLTIKILYASLFTLDWMIFSISCLVFSIVLLKKAITFHCWSHKTLIETIKTLNLDNKKITESNI